MSDIPMFSARGKTDSELVAEISTYLPSLSSAIDQALLSIDFSNLNADLAGRINKSITEHQDLSGFASKNFARKNFYDKSQIDAKVNSINSNVEYLSNDVNYIRDNTYDQYIIDSKLQEIWEAIEALQEG